MNRINKFPFARSLLNVVVTPHPSNKRVICKNTQALIYIAFLIDVWQMPLDYSFNCILPFQKSQGTIKIELLNYID